MLQDTNTQPVRRYDLDWLRVLAFGLLILYHIGMFYVAEWEWHIKSDSPQYWLQDVMILSNQWRMSLLFFISAMILGLLSTRHSWQKTLKERSRRLLLPLVFGMLVVVPPQLFIELKFYTQMELGYGAFMREYLDMGTSLAPHKQSAIGLLTWNHLWFLPYLFCYTLIFLVIGPWVRTLASYLDTHLKEPKGYLTGFCAVVLLMTVVIWLALRREFPTTHDLLNDWYSHGKYFWVMVAGYFLSCSPRLWQALINARLLFLLTAIVAYALIIADRHDGFPLLAQQFETNIWVRLGYGLVFTTNHWAWILAIVGYAGQYLNRSSALISYLNTAILPYYMLHQTLIVVLAFVIAGYQLNSLLEFGILLAGTLVGCQLGYLFVRRVPVLRQCFGLTSLQQSGGKARIPVKTQLEGAG